MKNFNKTWNKIIILSLCIIFCLLVTSCANLTSNEKKYYSDMDNYVEATGVIDYILFDDQKQTVYVGFSTISKQFDDDCFKIVGKNYSIIVEDGAKEKLKIGETVSFVTAPKYFGNGFVMPIVELSIGDYCMLDFETGYVNFLNWLNE